MDTNNLSHQITSLIKIAKIPDEEKTKISSQLPSLSIDQLERLKANFIQQISIDIFFDSYEELQKENKILDDAAVDEIEKRIAKKFEETQELIITDSELSSIRQSLQAVQQKVINPPGVINSTSSTPATPVASSPASPVASTTATPDSPVSPKV
jgi:hypothetical protein